MKPRIEPWSAFDIFIIAFGCVFYLTLICLLVWWRHRFTHPGKDRFLKVWRHPAVRLITAACIVYMNVYLFAEDPTVHSRRRASLGVFGLPINLLFGKWPPEIWQVVVKVAVAIVGLISGVYIGRVWIHHKLLQNRLNLELFENGRGTFVVTFIFCFAWLIPMALAYNFVLNLSASREVYAIYRLTGVLGMTSVLFSKVTGSVTALGDTFTIIMVADSLLQDDSQYKNWASPSVREWWRVWRLPATIIMMAASMALLLGLIWGNFWNYTYEKIEWIGVFASSEFTRALFAGIIGLLNISVVTQDWDFPSFDNPLEIKMVFLNSNELSTGPFVRKLGPSFSKRLNWFVEKTEVKIEGKWFNYSVLVLTMILDLINVNSIVGYRPAVNAQYIGPEGHIWTITDISQAQDLRTVLTWDARQGDLSGDLPLHAQFWNYSRIIIYALAFAPYVIGVFIMLEIIRKYNRHPDDVARRRRLRAARRARVKLQAATAFLKAIKRTMPEDKHEDFVLALHADTDDEDAIARRVSIVLPALGGSVGKEEEHLLKRSV